MMPLTTRTIYKSIEPITVFVVFDPGLTVLIDLIDGETDVSLATGLVMTESAVIAGLYRRTFTVAALDTLLDPQRTERLVAWQARLSPHQVGVDNEIGVFYRGGHVDLPHAAFISPFTTRIAPEEVPERFVEPTQIDSQIIPVGFGYQIRRLYEYVPESGDVREVVDILEQA